MDSVEALRGGDLAAALEAAKQDVRKAPRDPRLRTYLFQLFCVTGEWDRALTQLKVVGELDAAAEPMVTTYQAAIRCEILREKVFRGERSPTVLGDPGPWVPLLIEAVRLLAVGQNAEAAARRDEAFGQAPDAAVTIDGVESAWVADADPRLGPIVELIVEGRYLWAPIPRIKTMVLEKPADLRDQVWMPARLTWSNDGEAVALIPSRYLGSAGSKDPLIQLARKTEWTELDDDWAMPIGQRMLVTDTGETALLDLRKLTVAAAESSPAEPPPAEIASAQPDAVAANSGV